jgi:replicative DNA helicase
VDIARHVSVRNRLRSALFSLEMPRKELMRRIISAEARVMLHHLAPGCMIGDDWQRAANVRERVVTAPLVIDDSPDATVMRIRTKARRLKQTSGLDLIVIDYLQLISTGQQRRFDNRQNEVSAISRGLKLLARELNIPVVVLAQLNRGPEQRQDKRPMLSDLRESGSLEQDADVVILLHREDAYERECARAGEADLIVAKHRNGPTATITVAFQGHYARFVDMKKS